MAYETWKFNTAFTMAYNQLYQVKLKPQKEITLQCL